MSEHGRFYPDAPRVGVGVTVLRPSAAAGEWEVLLVRRAKPPAQGMWSLPGGGVELGGNHCRRRTPGSVGGDGAEHYARTGLHRSGRHSP
ncbi:MAG: NUDIX domain-containing protein [Ardenticatenia bacterium]|nr:NUDIX domain-containing protein [Ardenticatenia bacterium]